MRLPVSRNLGAFLVVLAAGGALPARAASTPPVPGAGAAPEVRVTVEPLTKQAFRPFGELVEVPEGMKPSIENAILSYWGGLAKARFHEEMEFGLFRVKARAHDVAEMERHAKTPELLLGLSSDYVLLVAPRSGPRAGGAHPDVAKVRAFQVPKGKALLLARGTWHALPFPGEKQGEFLVGFRNLTATRDLTLKAFKDRAVVKF